jgi:hypothetical protein
MHQKEKIALEIAAKSVNGPVLYLAILFYDKLPWLILKKERKKETFIRTHKKRKLVIYIRYNTYVI